MKPRENLPLLACASLVLALVPLLACKKAPPSADGGPEAGATLSDAGSTAPPELSARVVLTGAAINEQQAQAMGMQFAAKRWPQYHPRFAVALHEPRDWKVLIQFQEPGVGGMVIYDFYGQMLDAGTSKGEH